MIDFDDTIHDDRFWTVVGGVLTRNTSKELRIASTCGFERSAGGDGGEVLGRPDDDGRRGLFYDNSFYPAGTSTLTGVTNGIDLAPWSTSGPIVIDQIGVAVATAVASTSVKVVIYGSDANGWPGALLYESAAIPTIATGFSSWRSPTSPSSRARPTGSGCATTARPCSGPSRGQLHLARPERLERRRLFHEAAAHADLRNSRAGRVELRLERADRQPDGAQRPL
jgi:hypothetical protein